MNKLLWAPPDTQQANINEMKYSFSSRFGLALKETSGAFPVSKDEWIKCGQASYLMNYHQLFF